jgi:hypothetical protein
MVTRALAAIALLAFAIPALANELFLDRKSITTGDTVTITVSLDGDFAALESVDIPLRNLAIDGAPSVSTSFTLINGDASRRRTLQYVARPLAAGPAVVGPIVVTTPGGQRDTLAAVSLTVADDRTAATNDPRTILRALIADRRPPIFVIAQADRSEVYVGQEVVVTWTVYNAATAEQLGISAAPALDDFWSEEIPLGDRDPVPSVIDDLNVEQLPIRRVALFPLHSGTLTVGPLTIAAAVMTRVPGGGPFGMFEGRIENVRWRSAPLTIEVKPLPPGPPADVSGDVTLRCEQAQQRSGGPVVLGVRLIGRGNLRAATAPHLAGAVDGTLQIAEDPVSVTRSRDAAEMTRRWRYLIFPARSGTFMIPPIVATTITSAGQRAQLRCVAQTLPVEMSEAPAPRDGVSSALPARAARLSLAWLAALVALIAVVAMSIPRARRGWRRRTAVNALLRNESPAEMRAAVEQWLRRARIEPVNLAAEPSDRGDAFRALRSFLDGLEHERIAPDEGELRARLRDLVDAIDA